MITLIIGGSGSGKSVYAENFVLDKAKEDPRVYLATMQVYDAEGKEKIRKHRIQREGKNFQTIEQPRNISMVIEQLHKEDTVLLECMSNLVANEMFCDQGVQSCNSVTEKILKDVQKMSEKINHLVIVSNNIFEDGMDYDASTMEYLKALGKVNVGIAKIADTVIEVVVGIPLQIKQEVKRCIY